MKQVFILLSLILMQAIAFGQETNPNWEEIYSKLGPEGKRILTEDHSQFKDNNSHLELIRLLQQLYISEERVLEDRFGLEIEYTGITRLKALQIVQEIAGGELDVTKLALSNSRLSNDPHTVIAYVDGQLYKYDDWVNENNQGKEDPLRRFYQYAREAMIAPNELVLPPMTLDKLPLIEKIVKALSVAGAKPGKIIPTAIHPNIEVDPKDYKTLVNLLKNYARNAKPFRVFLDPSESRQKSEFIPVFPKEFEAILLDPNYDPTLEEFWKDLKKYVHPKFTTINVIHSLIMESAHPDLDPVRRASVMVDYGVKPRPAFELREPNTTFQEGRITDFVLFGIALHRASQEDGNLEINELKLKLMDRLINKPKSLPETLRKSGPESKQAQQVIESRKFEEQRKLDAQIRLDAMKKTRRK